MKTQQEELFDRILIVDAPDERRIEWITQRSGLSRGEIEKIIESQTSRENRFNIADDIIANDGSLDELYQQVESLHQKYQRLAEDLKSPT